LSFQRPFAVRQVAASGFTSVALGLRLLQEAARLDCPAVYFTTHIPDFYKRFGAELHEPIGDDFWILRMDIHTPT